MNDSKIEKFLESVKISIQNKNEIFCEINHLDLSGKTVEIWKKHAQFAINFLENKNVEYCLFKVNNFSFAKMGDVDILIEDKEKLKDIYKNLDEMNFIFHHVPFNEKLKITAKDPKSNFEIDFYPEPKWSELRYAPDELIISNRRRVKKHEIDAYVPSPEHEIYIIASHAYNHGRILLSEVINTAIIILEDDPDLDEIISLSEKFHFQNAIFVLLISANNLLKKFGFDSIQERYFKRIHNIAEPSIVKKFSNVDLDNFPLNFSIQDLIILSLRKITASNLDKSTSKFDELNNFIKHNRISNKFYSTFYPNYHNNKPVENIKQIISD